MVVQLERKLKKGVQDDVEFAKKSSEPPMQDLWNNIYMVSMHAPAHSSRLQNAWRYLQHLNAIAVPSYQRQGNVSGGHDAPL